MAEEQLPTRKLLPSEVLEKRKAAFTSSNIVSANPKTFSQAQEPYLSFPEEGLRAATPYLGVPMANPISFNANDEKLMGIIRYGAAQPQNSKDPEEKRVPTRNLEHAVKGFVDNSAGPGVYEDLRSNVGMNDLDILSNVVGITKRPVPRLDAMLEAGMSSEDMVQIFLNDLGLDKGELKKSGVDPMDLYMAFHEGVRDPSYPELMTESAIRGGATAYTAGKVGAATTAALSPLSPFVSVPAGIGAGLISAIGTNVALDQVLPSEDIIDSKKRAFLQGTQIAAEGVGGLTYGSTVRSITDKALSAQSGFLKRLADTAKTQDFNLDTNPLYSIGLAPASEATLLKSDPVLLKMFRDGLTPKTRALFEAPAIAGASTFGGYAEGENMGMAGSIGMEVSGGLTGQSLVSFKNLLPIYNAAKKSISDGKFDDDFTESKTEQRVGEAIRDTLFKFEEGNKKLNSAGEVESFSVDELIELLRSSEYADLAKGASREYDGELRPLLESMKIPAPSSAAVTGSKVFEMIQGRLETGPDVSAEFRAKMQAARAREATAINEIIVQLRLTGNPKQIQAANALTERYFNQMVGEQLIGLQQDAQKVIDRLAVPQIPLDPNKYLKGQQETNTTQASRKINSMIKQTLNEVKQQENALYDLVPNNILVGQNNFLAALEDIKRTTDPKLLSTVLPKAIQGMDEEASTVVRAVALQTRIDELSIFLPNIRRGMPGGDPSLPSFAEAGGEDALGLANYRVEPELTKLQKELDSLDVDPDSIQPRTYEQRKGLRTYLNKLETAALSGNPDAPDARVYKILAEGIRKDLADLESLQQLNGTDVATADGLLAVENARAFSRAKNDVFLRAFPQEALKSRATGEELIDPQELYLNILSGRDSVSRRKIQEIDKAFQFLTDELVPGNLSKDLAAQGAAFRRSTDLQSQVSLLVRSMAQNKNIIDPSTGMPDGVKIDAFINQNKEVLALIPGLTNDLQDAGRRGVLFKQAQAKIEADKKDYFTPLVTDMTGEAPRIAFLNMWQGSNPEETIRSEINRLRKGVTQLRNGDSKIVGEELETFIRKYGVNPNDLTPEILNGRIRDTLFDTAEAFSQTNDKNPTINGIPNFNHIRNFFFGTMSQGQSVVAGGKPYSGKPLMEILIDEDIFSAEESLRLQRLLTAGAGTQKKILDPGFDITADIKTSGDVLTNLLTRVVGARAGTQVASLLPGTNTNALIAGAAGSQAAQALIQKVPITSTFKVLTRAIEDPKYMATLLEKAEVSRKAGTTLGPVDVSSLMDKTKTSFKEKAQAGYTAAKVGAGLVFDQAKQTAALSVYLKNALGLRPTEQLVEGEPTEEEYEEARTFRKENRTNRRKLIEKQDLKKLEDSYREQLTGEETPPMLPVRSVTQAPASLPSLPPPPAAAPNPQQRQQFAALFPNDPISSLINQQGIGSLPQAPS